jgi:8-oxo-dGTP pyrophosphatase MutT (NUDIX family)
MSNRSDQIEDKLKAKLSQERRKIPTDITPRVPAAVLIPFVCVNDEWNLLFTKRTNDMAKHQGEISFPGGAAEKDDDDLIETALRETCEEIGVVGSKIKVLGSIDPVPTVSNYCVLPVIGIIDWPIELIINTSEVEKTLLIPVEWLKQEENWYQSEFFFDTGKSKTVIHYKDIGSDHLWGLTAMLAQKAIELI